MVIAINNNPLVNLSNKFMACCDKKVLVSDARCNTSSPTSICREIPLCEDGTVAPHPLTGLFLYDKRFSLFSKYKDDPECEGTISRIFWEIEDFYKGNPRELEAKLYHVAHVLYLSEVNASTNAEARQGIAAKAGQLLNVTTETFAEGTSSIDAVDSSYMITPFGRHLRTLIHQTNVGFLQLD